jgi:hypothetical protein
VSTSAYVTPQNFSADSNFIRLEQISAFPELASGRLPASSNEVVITQDMAEALHNQTRLELDSPRLSLTVVGVTPSTYLRPSTIFTNAKIPESVPVTVSFSWSEPTSALEIGQKLTVEADELDLFSYWDGPYGCLTPFCGIDRAALEATPRMDRFSQPTVGLALLASVIPLIFSALLAILMQRRYAPAMTTMLQLGVSRPTIRTAVVNGALRSAIAPSFWTISGAAAGWIAFKAIDANSLQPFGDYSPTWNYIAISVLILVATPIAASLLLTQGLLQNARRAVDRIVEKLIGYWDSKTVLTFSVALAVLTFPRMKAGQEFLQELLIASSITCIAGYGLTLRIAAHFRQKPGVTRVAAALALRNSQTLAFVFAGITLVTAYSSYNVSLFLTSQNQDRIEFVTSSPAGFVEVIEQPDSRAGEIASAATGQTPIEIYESVSEADERLAVIQGREGRGHILGIPGAEIAEFVLKTDLSEAELRLLESGGALIGTNGADGLEPGTVAIRKISLDGGTVLEQGLTTAVVPMDAAWSNGSQAIMLTSAMQSAGLPVQPKMLLFEDSTQTRKAIRQAFIANDIDVTAMHVPPQWSPLPFGEKFIINLLASLMITTLLVSASAGAVAQSARKYLATLVALGSRRRVISRVLFSQMIVIAVVSSVAGIAAVLALLAGASLIPGRGIFVVVPIGYMALALASAVVTAGTATAIIQRKVRPSRAYDYIN